MESNLYQQHPHLFSFEPGDGTSYWVLFGRQQESWGSYTIFGFGEHSSPLTVFPFQGRAHIPFATFIRSMRFNQSKPLYLGDSDYIEEAAWTVFCTLVGQHDERAELAEQWAPDWRFQLPQSLLETSKHTL